MTKKVYRVCNWNNYNKSLVSRGSLTFWFSEKAISQWEERGEKRHGNERYSDIAICCSLTLRQLFRLPLRATQGMVRSLVELMNLTIKIPDYSTLSRRGKKLKVDIKVPAGDGSRHVLVDSTGVQIIGEGEWKKLKHGASRYRLWRKLHITMDADNQTILSAEMTESGGQDGSTLAGLIDKIEGPIHQITGDGAYDKKACYRTAHQRGARAVFPPQHDAIVQRNKIKKDPALLPRDETILYIQSGENKEAKRKEWKKVNNYHRRSLIETMMWRMKSIFGDQLRSRTFENQETDLLIRCYAINKMNELGLPVTRVVA